MGRHMSALGNLIKNARLSKNLTQEELGARVGCTGSHITGVEKGRHLSKSLMEAIAGVLDLDLTETSDLNDIEFLRAKVRQIKNPDLRTRLIEATLNNGERARSVVIGGLCICEDSEEYRTLEKAVTSPDKHPIITDEKEARLIKAFRRIPTDRVGLLVTLAETLAEGKK